MKKIFLILMILYLPCFIFSHTHWLIPNNFQSDLNEEITLSICSGHDFPESSFALNQKLITHLKMMGPDKAIDYRLEKKKNLHSGVVQIEKKGVYLCMFQLKKPQLKKPLFFGSTLLYVGNPEFSIEHFTHLEGFFILPMVDIRKIRPKESVSFKILLDGEPISTNCQIYSPKSKTIYLKSDKKGDLSFPIKKEGIYLIEATHQGQSASFTFKIEN